MSAPGRDQGRILRQPFGLGTIRGRLPKTSGTRPPETSMLMTAADYRESLRRYKPRVFVDGAASRASPTSRRCSPASTPSA